RMPPCNGSRCSQATSRRTGWRRRSSGTRTGGRTGASARWARKRNEARFRMLLLPHPRNTVEGVSSGRTPMRCAVCLAGLVLLAGGALVRGADDIVPEGPKLEKLWGEGTFTEGPAYGPDGFVYFSDIGNRMSAMPNKRAASVTRMKPWEKAKWLRTFTGRSV